MNAALSLPSFWGKPPALLDQMERELQSHFDIHKAFSAWSKECVHACASAVQTGDHRDVWLGREAVENDPGLGLWVFFNCYVSILTDMGVFIADRP